jgi:hypothetical protein
MENPYSSPQYEAQPLENQGGVLSDSMIENLRAASPWIRFISVLGFVSSGFLALSAIITLLGGGAIVALLAKTTESYDMGTLFGGGMIAFLGVILAACAVFYFLPSFYAYKFGTKLRNYYLTRSGYELEDAFKNNHSMWKFLGIVCVIGLALTIFSVPILAIIGALASVL